MATLAGTMEFPQLVDSSIAMLLAIATTLLAWFTKQLASVNERLRLIEECRESRDRIKIEYERLTQKIAAAEKLVTKCGTAPVEGLRGQSSPPQPETSLIESLRILVDREKDDIPVHDLDRVAEVLMTVKLTGKSDLNVAETIVKPYQDLIVALESELPRWRQQQIEMLPRLFA